MTHADDILRVARDTRKANCMFVTFAGVDPFVKLDYFSLSVCHCNYGSVTRNLSCRGFKTVEIMLNNCLRKIWRLPANSHTGIIGGLVMPA